MVFSIQEQTNLFQTFRGIAGDAIRPGGLLLTKKAADQCGFQAGARIADIGCGPGTTLQYLIHRRKCIACGVDISTQMLSQCHGLPVIQADADNLPFIGECLDGIFCECAMSLLALPARALKEFHRVLRPSGWLVLADIYLRNPQPETAFPASPAACLSGAVSRAVRESQITGCGFEIISWEDHTRYLTELSARMVWNLGSRKLLMDLLLPGIDPAETCRKLDALRPGYGGWIARKSE